MKTDDLKHIILKIFEGGEHHGYEVHRRLGSQGVEVEISRLYRVLNEMLKEDLLEGLWRKSQFGPKKKVYRLGKNGEKELNRMLADAIETVHIYYGKYLLGLPPEISVFDDVSRYVTDKLNERCNIVYVAPMISAMIEKSIQSLHSIAPLGKISLVKQGSAETNLSLYNLSILDGDYGDIPLKEGYADLEVIAYLPERDSIQAAMREWRRVLKESGTLAILVPTALMDMYQDPLTIGDFVEKYEKQKLKTEELVDKSTIQALLRESFNSVEEKKIVHMTILRARA